MKKKHHKKTSRSKLAKPHKRRRSLGHSAHAKRPSPHAKPEHNSLALLHAIRRRRDAERGEHHEPGQLPSAGHHRRKRSAHPARKPSHRQAEPVITEKSFEKMLALRKFQHHTR